MSSQTIAMIVRPGHEATFDTLRRVFGPKGYLVFWDRRIAERRRQNIPVPVERRRHQRRQERDDWNALQFKVAILRARSVQEEAGPGNVERRI